MKPPSWKKAGPDGEIEIKFPTGRRFKIEKFYDENLRTGNIRHKGEWNVYEWNPRTRDWEWGDTYKPKGYAKQQVMDSGQYNKQGKKVADYSDSFKYESVNENIKPHPDVIKAYKKTRDADDQAADYNYRGNKARVTRAANHLSNMIKKHHPDLNSQEKINLRTKLQNMDENAGLWANIRAKRARGKRMRKKGEKGAPTDAQIKRIKDKSKTEDTTTASVAMPPTAVFKAINVTDKRRRKDSPPVILKRFRGFMKDNA